MSLHPPQIVDVKRDVEGKIRGYIVSRNSQLTVVREFDGFLPEGFVAIPTSTVKEMIINELWTDMIQSEGHAELGSISPWFVTDNLLTALRSIRDREVNIILECEQCPDAEEFGFHIGRIVSLQSSSLDFVFFDSCGRWFPAPYSIPLASITKIVVDDPYVATFSKYVGRCPVETKLVE